MQGKNKALTFRQILKQVKLAKILTGQTRKNAYKIKVITLVAMVRCFPQHTYVTSDPLLPQFVLVGVYNSTWKLHAPVEQLSINFTF